MRAYKGSAAGQGRARVSAWGAYANCCETTFQDRKLWLKPGLVRDLRSPRPEGRGNYAEGRGNYAEGRGNYGNPDKQLTNKQFD